jgi:putative ATP-binding cassette transporter
VFIEGGSYCNLDNLSLTIVCILGSFAFATLFFLIKAIMELVRKERVFVGNGVKGALSFLLSLVVMGSIGYCIYLIPRVFFGGVSWAMIEEMGPITLIWAVLSLAVALPIFYLYFIFTTYFVKPKEKPYFLLIVLSILSGLGNSLLIMVINEALNRNLSYVNRWVGVGSGLYLYFLLGVLLFVVTAMVVRKRLITLTNDLVYEKRMEIINIILKAPYDKVEALEEGKISAGLNNDTEVISTFVNSLVNGLTGIITITSCLVYLGTINIYGLIASVLIISIASGLFLKASKNVEKLWEKSRDIQNEFFKFIYALIYGFKELYINSRKRSEFAEDIEKSCKMYRETRIKGEFKIVGVSITGELLFTMVIGVVVFTFSIIFPNIQGNTLRTYVLVYLYMGGVVTSEINIIPGFVRVMISWRRINELIQELSVLETEQLPTNQQAGNSQLTLELKDVGYHYKSQNGEQFMVGPINYTFKSGEIVFITGGNGSGKSTLAKLLTGIYQPDCGEILINGQKIDSSNLGSYFSTVYSDFYLFEKLYGIDYEAKQAEIQKYLTILQLNDKLQINDRTFSTTKLSGGQRKRLALLISYLEDKPILLFDEWAADQDPEFRKFFYQTLLAELKNRGKVVIAITHDDHYYHTGDRILKMDMGQIVAQFDSGSLGNRQIAGTLEI